MPVRPPETSRGNIIAIVDDDPAVRNSLQFALEVEGFGVRVYPGAQAMLDDGRLADLCCIVVDQNMPVMTGLELIARLRNQSVRIPMILVTGQASAILHRRARDAGVPIVEKPFLGNALIDKIQHLVECGA